jgi:hypothetical protein
MSIAMIPDGTYALVTILEWLYIEPYFFGKAIVFFSFSKSYYPIDSWRFHPWRSNWRVDPPNRKRMLTLITRPERPMPPSLYAGDGADCGEGIAGSRRAWQVSSVFQPIRVRGNNSREKACV